MVYAHLTADPGAVEFEAYVFTSEFLAMISATHEEPVPVVSVTARHTLVGVEVSSAPVATLERLEDLWPLVVTLKYPDGSIVLTAEESEPRSVKRLEDFLPTILDDLAASVGRAERTRSSQN